jgi:hypothetical protein
MTLLDESGRLIKIVGSGAIPRLASGEYVTPGAVVFHKDGDSLVVEWVDEFRVGHFSSGVSFHASECYSERPGATHAP